ncbi:hypothetical protein QA596_02620 [Balneolales bacterium ANBcel1]|nr:hypothetical protein [Balneolales bacterium ANBcel1]
MRDLTMRLCAETTYDTGQWWSRVRVRHVLTQERIAEAEDETGGCMLTEVSEDAWLTYFNNVICRVSWCGPACRCRR